MVQSLTISAPIPVPGTQQSPTTPSLRSTTSTAIIQIAGASSSGLGDLHKTNSNGNSNGGTRVTTISTTNNTGLIGVGEHLHNSNNINGSHARYNKDHPGLGRFPSLGYTKKLHLENITQRSKIIELERYLQGLKEELILAHRQIHAKNLEAKISQERKAVEIHELGQHIQRCEFDLLAKTAECEALQNKLQYQTKDSVSKLKHITMLESEIMDYRRISIMSGHGPSPAGSGGVIARGGSVLFRNSRSSSDLSESVRSSVMQDNEDSVATFTGAMAMAALQAQVKQLKDDHWKKDEQILELSERIQVLTNSVAQLEKAAVAAEIARQMEDMKKEEETREEELSKPTIAGDQINIISESTSDASLSTAAADNVGYTQAPESATQLKSESEDLKTNMSVALDTASPTPSVSSMFNVPQSSILHSETCIKEEVLEGDAPNLAVSKLSTVLVAAAISRNSLHHPAASGLAPLNTVPANIEAMNTNSTGIVSASTSNDGGESPLSAVTSTSSPSTVVGAPALTRKSSLRYTREGQVSPPNSTNSTVTSTAPTTTNTH
ncbi:hypothetical protein FBU30_001990 [Linnemannia zychae]|nr:hypothetical protein FBU30_001990 [Linnemannia zychae]